MLDSILEHASLKTVALAVVGLWFLIKINTWIATDRKINGLGGHAQRVKTYLPGCSHTPLPTPQVPHLTYHIALDLLARAVYGTIHHKNLEAWAAFFAPCKPGSYTVEACPLGQRIIFTADPENIKAILATQFQDYGKGEPFHEEWKPFLGDSIFTTDLDQWHNSRQLIRPQFIKDRVSDLDVFEAHVQILIRAIANGGVVGTPGTATDGKGCGRDVDVSDLFFRYTLDAATDFLLGSSVDSLEIPNQGFAEAFGEVQRVQNMIARAG